MKQRKRYGRNRWKLCFLLSGYFEKSNIFWLSSTGTDKFQEYQKIKEILLNFESVPEADITPEVGSRGIITPFIIQNIETGEAIGFSTWNEVQENRYRYQVSHNRNGDITVKIVILEFLYCIVEFGT